MGKLIVKNCEERKFEIQLEEDCGDFYLYLIDENDDYYCILTISSNGSVDYDVCAIEDAGLTDAS